MSRRQRYSLSLGFVLSRSCYSYEPWHYRYVGRDTAAAVRERRVTLRHYPWETWATWETAPS